MIGAGRPHEALRRRCPRREHSRHQFDPKRLHSKRSELRELTNQINQWLGSLRRWHAWNEVLGKHEQEVRWATEWAWVEPLALQGMVQPSATRDRFIMVATNALHQVRMALDPKVKDELLGDPTTPDERRFFPSRRDKERQLKELA